MNPLIVPVMVHIHGTMWMPKSEEPYLLWYLADDNVCEEVDHFFGFIAASHFFAAGWAFHADCRSAAKHAASSLLPGA
jgi:hypothetical protein